jgi:hypothetical protein
MRRRLACHLSRVVLSFVVTIECVSLSMSLPALSQVYKEVKGVYTSVNVTGRVVEIVVAYHESILGLRSQRNLFSYPLEPNVAVTTSTTTTTTTLPVDILH